MNKELLKFYIASVLCSFALVLIPYIGVLIHNERFISLNEIYRNVLFIAMNLALIPSGFKAYYLRNQ